MPIFAGFVAPHVYTRASSEYALKMFSEHLFVILLGVWDDVFYIMSLKFLQHTFIYMAFLKSSSYSYNVFV